MKKEPPAAEAVPGDVPQTGNIHGPSIHKRGETEQGFKDADVIVEGHYVTQVQTHSALETHGVVADWKPDMLTVWASTQGTASVREELAGFFKIPLTQVRVITEYMGGGFGAKFGAGNPGVVAAALSKKTGAPVRLMLDREEEHLSVGNRPSSDQVLRIGAKNDGTITAIHLVAYGTAGCGTGAGCSGPAANLYKSASLHTEENDVFINAGPASAMRAPGHPQGAFALEQTIDDLAVKLNMDPIDLRDKADDAPGASRRASDRARERHLEVPQSRSPALITGPIKRGVGLGQSVWYRFVSHGLQRRGAHSQGWIARSPFQRAGHRLRRQDRDGADSGGAIWRSACTNLPSRSATQIIPRDRTPAAA